MKRLIPDGQAGWIEGQGMPVPERNEASSNPLVALVGNTAGGFDDVERRLRERKHTIDDDEASLPKDALKPLGMHANGQQFYYSRLDVEAADAIHALGVALASQIEITNRERALAESAATALDASRVGDGFVLVPRELLEQALSVDDNYFPVSVFPVGLREKLKALLPAAPDADAGEG